MRSIWETLIRIIEADDPGDRPEVKARLKRAHDALKAKGQPTQGSDQARRDAQARVMADPHASKVMSQMPTPDDVEPIPGQTDLKGTADAGYSNLPKPVQGAPGSATGIGAGAIAAKNAEPTSVSLGAKARQFDPQASGIRNRFGVNPDVFYGDRRVKVDPTTGKFKDVRGRPKKQDHGDPVAIQAELDKLQKLLQKPKTDRHRDWLQQRIKDKTAELEKAQNPPEPESPETVDEPFADMHAAAIAKNTGPKPQRPKPTGYDVGPWQQAAGHLPKGGEVRQSGKSQGVGASTAGSSKLVATGGERAPEFHGQEWSPAGYTAPADDEWEKNPELSARRVGGKGGGRVSYGQQATGQRGRMSIPANAGRGEKMVGNKDLGKFQTQADFDAYNQSQDLKAKIAAKLALKAQDISTKRFGGEKAPWRGRADVSGLGQAVDKSADAQKKDAAAQAIANKPLHVNTRRDPESEKPAQTVKGAEYAPEPTKGQSGGSAGSSGEGPIDREKMKQALAQRIAQMAAKKQGK